MAGVREAHRPGGLRSGARPPRRAAPARRFRGAAARPRMGRRDRGRPVAGDFREFRPESARLAVPPERLRRSRSGADPRRTRHAPPGLRRGAAPRLRGENPSEETAAGGASRRPAGGRTGGVLRRVAAAGADPPGGARLRRCGPGPAGRAFGAWCDGTVAPRDRSSGGPAVRRARAAADLGPRRGELGLARLPDRRHGRDRRPSDRRRHAPAARRTAASRRTARPAARGAAPHQPPVPERCQRAPLRTGAPRALRAAARPAGGPRRLARFAPPADVRRGTQRGLPGAAHRGAADDLPALRRGARPAADRRRDLPALVLAHRPLRPTPRRRGVPPGHHGPALRRLGPVPRPLPPGPRRGRLAPAPGAPGCALRPRPFPVPRRPRAGRGAAAPPADRTAAPPRRRDLAGAREAARPRRRTDLLPDPRCGAHRLGVRDDDGLPAGARRRPLARHPRREETRRPGDRGPRGAVRRAARRTCRPAPGADGPQADPHRRESRARLGFRRGAPRRARTGGGSESHPRSRPSRGR